MQRYNADMENRSEHTPAEQIRSRIPDSAPEPDANAGAPRPRIGRTDQRDAVEFYDFAVSPAARNAHPEFGPEPPREPEEDPRPKRPSVRAEASAHPAYRRNPGPRNGRRGRNADKNGRPLPGTPMSISNVRTQTGVGGHAHPDIYVASSKRTSWTEAVYKPVRPQRPVGAYLLAAAGIALAAALAFAAFSAIKSCSADKPVEAPPAEQPAIQQPAFTPDPDVPTQVVGAGSVTSSGDGRVTFCAVGDNVINMQLIDFADANAGSMGDGAYDFAPLYSEVSPAISSYDLAFINQETVLGTNEDFDYAGYPSFNSPDILAKNLVDAGWDMVNCNSNHTYDIGPKAIRHEIEVWKGFPDVVTAGMYATEEEAQTIRVIERNGIRVAFLSYGYGLNGYENHEVEDGSLVNFYTDEKLQRDIPKAKRAADIVVVSMHWGDEYTNEPNETQRIWAQKCADLGADVVVGTHTHFIQPVEWLKGESGNDTLVAWCLGDFASGYTWIDCILGGMLSCDFVRGENGKATVQNVRWTPTIEHMENGEYRVFFLKDYTAEMAARNELFSSDNSSNTAEMLADPLTYVRTKTESVIGPDIPIDM